MVPHGDRKDRAESRRVEHHERSRIDTEHDVVGVLILRDGFERDDPRLGSAGPTESVLESLELPRTVNQVTHAAKLSFVSGCVP
jgi:hypothetical protein